MKTGQEHSNEQWKKVKLGEVVVPLKGKLTEQSDCFHDDWKSLINTTAIDGESKTWANPINAVLCEPDDVLMLWDGERSGLVITGKQGVVGSTFARLRPNHELDGKYLYFFLLNNFEWIQNRRTGTGVPHAPKDLMRIFQISYPESLPAQRRIAAILTSADKVIAATQKTIAKYKQIKQGMMEDLLKPKDGWKKYEYKDVIIENRLGGNYENSTANIGYPVIKMGNIMRGYISLEKMQYLSFEKKYIADDVLKKGDLLFNTRNTLDLVGKVSIWNNELPFALYNSNLLRMKFDENIIGSNEFMNYYFNYHKTLMELRGFAIGTTSVAAIYGRDLDRLSIIVPSIKEQRRIAAILSGIDAKIAAEEKVLEKYEKVKKGLMERLLNEQCKRKEMKKTEI